MENRLDVGQRADFTVFDLVDSDLEATDSNGDVSRLKRLFEPRYAVIGAEAIAASRYVPRARKLVRHSHGYSALNRLERRGGMLSVFRKE